MKVFIYCLISLTIPLVILLVLPLLASADTIFFKDGMRVDVGPTWKEDGKVKWKMAGIVIGYPEEDVERIEKSPIEKDSVSPAYYKSNQLKRKRVKVRSQRRLKRTVEHTKTSNTLTSSQSIKEEIAAFAKRQYPNDSRMQKYVYQKQMSAYKYMLTVNDPDVKQIAVRSYPDDYAMQKYVYSKQLSAKQYMKTAANKEINRFALKSYPNDYAMQQYVYNKQFAAKQYMDTVTNSAAKSRAQKKYPYDYSMQKYVYDKIVY